MVKDNMEKVGLPPRTFLYTLDQVAMMLEMKVPALRDRFVYFEGRSLGVRPRDQFLARDISEAGAPKPDWRVAERELVRWMKVKGFQFHQRGWVIK